jgi:hypothetical protein
MKRMLFTLTLALFGSSLASAGYVTIHNRANETIEVFAYDSNDSIAGGLFSVTSEHGSVGAGATRRFNCNSGNGGKIYIREYVWLTELYGMGQVNNGSYHLDSQWHRNPVGPGINFDRSVSFTRAPANGSEVSFGLVNVPLPGGGASDCLSTSQGNTLLTNGKLELDWQGDGNLVLYRIDNGSPVWASDTAGMPPTCAFRGTAIWSSTTTDRPSGPREPTEPA